MASCRVVKGGWSWKGEMQQAGALISGVSPEWVQNRVNDGGLVEPIEDAEPVIESAVDEPKAETAVSPRQRARRKE